MAASGKMPPPRKSSSSLVVASSSAARMKIPNFHLRRIGPSATKPGVADVMDFDKVTTLIGRNRGQVDYVLDSSDPVASQYISRLHARVIRQEQSAHRLYDDSLNGIFINNTKICGSVILQEGDVVTFGHPHGVKLSPGMWKRQPDSEYQFIFEKCSCQHQQTKTRKRPNVLEDKVNISLPDHKPPECDTVTKKSKTDVHDTDAVLSATKLLDSCITRISGLAESLNGSVNRSRHDVSISTEETSTEEVGKDDVDQKPSPDFTQIKQLPSQESTTTATSTQVMSAPSVTVQSTSTVLHVKTDADPQDSSRDESSMEKAQRRITEFFVHPCNKSVNSSGYGGSFCNETFAADVSVRESLEQDPGQKANMGGHETSREGTSSGNGNENSPTKHTEKTSNVDKSVTAVVESFSLPLSTSADKDSVAEQNIQLSLAQVPKQDENETKQLSDSEILNLADKDSACHELAKSSAPNPTCVVSIPETSSDITTQELKAKQQLGSISHSSTPNFPECGDDNEKSNILQVSSFSTTEEKAISNKPALEQPHHSSSPSSEDSCAPIPKLSSEHVIIHTAPENCEDVGMIGTATVLHLAELETKVMKEACMIASEKEGPDLPIANQEENNVASALSQEENNVAPIVSEENNVATTISQEENKDASTVSQEENNVAPTIVQEENNVASTIVQEENNVAPTIVQEESNVAPSVSQEESSVASTVSQEESNVAPTVSQEENNVAFTVVPEENNVAPTIVQEENNVAPTVSQEESNVAPTVSQEESNVAPTVSQEESNVAPTVSQEESNVAPTVSHEESSVAPTVSQEESNVAPTVSQEENNVAPTVSQEESNVAPTVSQEESSVAPTVSQEESNVAPTVGKEESNIASTVRQEESNVASTVIQEENNVASTIRQEESNVAPTVHQEESNVASTVSQEENNVAPTISQEENNEPIENQEKSVTTKSLEENLAPTVSQEESNIVPIVNHKENTVPITKQGVTYEPIANEGQNDFMPTKNRDEDKVFTTGNEEENSATLTISQEENNVVLLANQGENIVSCTNEGENNERIANHKDNNVITVKEQEGIVAPTISQEENNTAASLSQEENSVASALSQEESNVATALSQEESNVATALSQEESNVASALSQEESNVASALSQEESNVASALSQEESNVASALSQEESNVASALSQEESNVAYALSQEESNVASALSKKESNVASALSQEESNVAPTVSQEESNVASALSQEEINVASAVSQEERNAAPTVSQEEGNVAFALGQEESNVASALSQEESSVASAVCQDESNVAPTVSQEESNVAPTVIQEERNVASALSQEESNVASAVSQEESNVASAVSQEENNVASDSSQENNVASAVGQEDSNVAPIVSQEENNVASSGSQEENVASAVGQEENNVAPTGSQGESSVAFIPSREEDNFASIPGEEENKLVPIANVGENTFLPITTSEDTHSSAQPNEAPQQSSTAANFSVIPQTSYSPHSCPADSQKPATSKLPSPNITAEVVRAVCEDFETGESQDEFIIGDGLQEVLKKFTADSRQDENDVRMSQRTAASDVSHTEKFEEMVEESGDLQDGKETVDSDMLHSNSNERGAKSEVCCDTPQESEKVSVVSDDVCSNVSQMDILEKGEESEACSERIERSYGEDEEIIQETSDIVQGNSDESDAASAKENSVSKEVGSNTVLDNNADTKMAAKRGEQMSQKTEPEGELTPISGSQSMPNSSKVVVSQNPDKSETILSHSSSSSNSRTDFDGMDEVLKDRQDFEEMQELVKKNYLNDDTDISSQNSEQTQEYLNNQERKTGYTEHARNDGLNDDKEERWNDDERAFEEMQLVVRSNYLTNYSTSYHNTTHDRANRPISADEEETRVFEDMQELVQRNYLISHDENLEINGVKHDVNGIHENNFIIKETTASSKERDSDMQLTSHTSGASDRQEKTGDDDGTPVTHVDDMTVTNSGNSNKACNSDHVSKTVCEDDCLLNSLTDEPTTVLSTGDKTYQSRDTSHAETVCESTGHPNADSSVTPSSSEITCEIDSITNAGTKTADQHMLHTTVDQPAITSDSETTLQIISGTNDETATGETNLQNSQDNTVSLSTNLPDSQDKGSNSTLFTTSTPTSENTSDLVSVSDDINSISPVAVHVDASVRGNLTQVTKKADGNRTKMFSINDEDELQSTIVHSKTTYAEGEDFIPSTATPASDKTLCLPESSEKSCQGEEVELTFVVNSDDDKTTAEKGIASTNDEAITDHEEKDIVEVKQDQIVTLMEEDENLDGITGEQFRGQETNARQLDTDDVKSLRESKKDLDTSSADFSQTVDKSRQRRVCQTDEGDKGSEDNETPVKLDDQGDLQGMECKREEEEAHSQIVGNEKDDKCERKLREDMTVETPDTECTKDKPKTQALDTECMTDDPETNDVYISSTPDLFSQDVSQHSSQRHAETGSENESTRERIHLTDTSRQTSAEHTVTEDSSQEYENKNTGYDITSHSTRSDVDSTENGDSNNLVTRVQLKQETESDKTTTVPDPYSEPTSHHKTTTVPDPYSEPTSHHKTTTVPDPYSEPTSHHKTTTVPDPYSEPTSHHKTTTVPDPYSEPTSHHNSDIHQQEEENSSRGEEKLDNEIFKSPPLPESLTSNKSQRDENLHSSEESSSEKTECSVKIPNDKDMTKDDNEIAASAESLNDDNQSFASEISDFRGEDDLCLVWSQADTSTDKTSSLEDDTDDMSPSQPFSTPKHSVENGNMKLGGANRNVTPDFIQVRHEQDKENVSGSKRLDSRDKDSCVKANEIQEERTKSDTVESHENEISAKDPYGYDPKVKAVAQQMEEKDALEEDKGQTSQQRHTEDGGRCEKHLTEITNTPESVQRHGSDSQETVEAKLAVEGAMSVFTDEDKCLISDGKHLNRLPQEISNQEKCAGVVCSTEENVANQENGHAFGKKTRETGVKRKSEEFLYSQEKRLKCDPAVVVSKDSREISEKQMDDDPMAVISEDSWATLEGLKDDHKGMNSRESCLNVREENLLACNSTLDPPEDNGQNQERADINTVHVDGLEMATATSDVTPKVLDENKDGRNDTTINSQATEQSFGNLSLEVMISDASLDNTVENLSDPSHNDVNVNILGTASDLIETGITKDLNENKDGRNDTTINSQATEQSFGNLSLEVMVCDASLINTVKNLSDPCNNDVDVNVPGTVSDSVCLTKPDRESSHVSNTESKREEVDENLDDGRICGKEERTEEFLPSHLSSEESKDKEESVNEQSFDNNADEASNIHKTATSNVFEPTLVSTPVSCLPEDKLAFSFDTCHNDTDTSHRSNEDNLNDKQSSSRTFEFDNSEMSEACDNEIRGQDSEPQAAEISSKPPASLTTKEMCGVSGKRKRHASQSSVEESVSSPPSEKLKRRKPDTDESRVCHSDEYVNGATDNLELSVSCGDQKQKIHGNLLVEQSLDAGTTCLASREGGTGSLGDGQTPSCKTLQDLPHTSVRNTVTDTIKNGSVKVLHLKHNPTFVERDFDKETDVSSSMHEKDDTGKKSDNNFYDVNFSPSRSVVSQEREGFCVVTDVDKETPQNKSAIPKLKPVEKILAHDRDKHQLSASVKVLHPRSIFSVSAGSACKGAEVKSSQHVEPTENLIPHMSKKVSTTVSDNLASSKSSEVPSNTSKVLHLLKGVAMETKYQQSEQNITDSLENQGMYARNGKKKGEQLTCTDAAEMISEVAATPPPKRTKVLHLLTPPKCYHMNSSTSSSALNYRNMGREERDLPSTPHSVHSGPTSLSCASDKQNSLSANNNPSTTALTLQNISSGVFDNTIPLTTKSLQNQSNLSSVSNTDDMSDILSQSQSSVPTTAALSPSCSSMNSSLTSSPSSSGRFMSSQSSSQLPPDGETPQNKRAKRREKLQSVVLSELQRLHKEIRSCLKVGKPNISQAVAALEDLDMLPINRQVLSTFPAVLETVRKCQKYAFSEEVRTLSAKIYTRFQALMPDAPQK